MTPHEELKEAETDVIQAEDRLRNANRRVGELRGEIRKTLTVGVNIPYKAGVLPDGRIVVVAHRDGIINDVWFTEIIPLNEDGTKKDVDYNPCS